MSSRSRRNAVPALLVVTFAALAAMAPPANADEVVLVDGQSDWNPACGAGCSMFAGFDIKQVTVARDAGTLRFTFKYWQPLAGTNPGDAAFEIYTTSTTVGDPDFYTTIAFSPTRKALFSRGHQIITDVAEDMPDGTTHVLEVPLSSIGDPSGFKFIAFLPGENDPSGPYPDMEELDLVPNSGFGGDRHSGGRLCRQRGGGAGGPGSTDTVAPTLTFVDARKTQDVDKLGLTLRLDEIADVTRNRHCGRAGRIEGLQDQEGHQAGCRRQAHANRPEAFEEGAHGDQEGAQERT